MTSCLAARTLASAGHDVEITSKPWMEVAEVAGQICSPLVSGDSTSCRAQAPLACARSCPWYFGKMEALKSRCLTYRFYR